MTADRPSTATLAIQYSAFAAVATALNILGQELSSRLYQGPYALAAAIAIGTAIGLWTKYQLDKKFIFRVQTNNLYHDAHLLILYAATGIVTTMIFWGTEFVFDAIWDTRVMRYLGAVLGLAAGYAIKYQLDKRYVF